MSSWSAPPSPTTQATCASSASAGAAQRGREFGERAHRQIRERDDRVAGAVADAIRHAAGGDHGDPRARRGECLIVGGELRSEEGAARPRLPLWTSTAEHTAGVRRVHTVVAGVTMSSLDTGAPAVPGMRTVG